MTEADLSPNRSGGRLSVTGSLPKLSRAYGAALQAIKARCPDAMELYLEVDQVIQAYPFSNPR